MLQTYEAYYHDGKIDLKEYPLGIKAGRVLITFLDTGAESSIPKIEWNELKKKKSNVDKWVGVLEGHECDDIKTQRREYIEKKHQ